MAGAQNPDVSIVVPVRNGAQTVAACIRSLLALEYPPERREVVVVDNGSTDSTGAIVRGFPVTCVTEERVGRSHARNRGIRESRSELVAFVDADCVADPGWLRELVAAFEPDEVDAVAGEILPHEPRSGPERYMARRLERWQIAAYTHERPYAVTANVAFRKRAFRRVGLFDPAFVTSEDVDLSYRFLAAGLVLRYAPDAIVRHRHRATARGLFAQQYWLGYGRALVRARYRLPQRSYELERWRRLGAALAGLVATATRRAARRAGADDLSYACYDVLLLSANRLGGLRWHLSGPRRRGRLRATTPGL